MSMLSESSYRDILLELLLPASKIFSDIFTISVMYV